MGDKYPYRFYGQICRFLSLQSFTRAPSGAWAGSGFPVELSAETSLVVPSPSGVLLAKAVRVSGAGAAPTGLFPAPVTAAPELGAHTRVDITDRTGSLVAAITLPSVVYADGWFEGCAWCPDESQLCVVAEAEEKKASCVEVAPKPASDPNDPFGGGDNPFGGGDEDPFGGGGDNPFGDDAGEDPFGGEDDNPFGEGDPFAEPAASKAISCTQAEALLSRCTDSHASYTTKMAQITLTLIWHPRHAAEVRHRIQVFCRLRVSRRRG